MNWKTYRYRMLNRFDALKSRILQWTLDEDKDLTLSVCSFVHFVKVKDRVLIKVRYRRYVKAPTRLYNTVRDPLKNPELIMLINQLEPARNKFMKSKSTVDHVAYINIVERIHTVCKQYAGK